MNESDRYIKLIIIKIFSLTNSLIIDKSFNSLISLLSIFNLNKTIRIVNEVHVTSLVIYFFDNKIETNRYLVEIRFNNASINNNFIYDFIFTFSFNNIENSN